MGLNFEGVSRRGCGMAREFAFWVYLWNVSRVQRAIWGWNMGIHPQASCRMRWHQWSLLRNVFLSGKNKKVQENVISWNWDRRNALRQLLIWAGKIYYPTNQDLSWIPRTHIGKKNAQCFVPAISERVRWPRDRRTPGSSWVSNPGLSEVPGQGDFVSNKRKHLRTDIQGCVLSSTYAPCTLKHSHIHREREKDRETENAGNRTLTLSKRRKYSDLLSHLFSPQDVIWCFVLFCLVLVVPLVLSESVLITCRIILRR